MNNLQEQKIKSLLEEEEFVKKLSNLTNENEILDFFNAQDAGLLNSDFEDLCDLVEKVLSEVNKKIDDKDLNTLSGGGLISWVVGHPIKTALIICGGALILGTGGFISNKLNHKYNNKKEV